MFLDNFKEKMGLQSCVGGLANSLQRKGNAERAFEIDISSCPKTLGH